MKYVKILFKIIYIINLNFFKLYKFLHLSHLFFEKDVYFLQ